MNSILLLAIIAIPVATVAVIVMQQRGAGRISLRARAGRWLRATFGPKDATPGITKATGFDDEQAWTGVLDLQLEPTGPSGSRTIALGHPTDAKQRPVRELTVYSQGDTPVGIVSGATGSWKSSSVLAEAVIMHGRDAHGHLLRHADGSHGAPMLLAAPKTELIELCLRSRLQQGRVTIIDVGSGRDLPRVGATDEYGRPRPALHPYLAQWSPLSECGDWAGSLATAKALCSGAMGGASAGGNADFWESSAARLVAAALWMVRRRGPGGCLADVYRAINEARPVGGDGPPASPIAALDAELQAWMTAPDATTAKEAELAHLAIVDLVDGAEATIGSIRNTAGTALSAALTEGLAWTAWDDPAAVSIRELLVQTSGTIVLLGTFSELRAYRPITSAFIDATRRTLEAEAKAAGGRLPRQVLVVIDELATIVGSGELFGEWLASARSQHVQLLWAAQDVAGLDAAFGEHHRTRVLNNTVTRLWLPFTADVHSLELAEKLGGEHLVWVEARTEGDTRSRTTAKGEGGGAQRSDGTTTSVTRTQQWRAIAPAGRVAAMKAGEALMLAGAHTAQLALRQWFTQPTLRAIVETGDPPGAPSPGAPQPSPPPASWPGGLRPPRHHDGGFIT